MRYAETFLKRINIGIYKIKKMFLNVSQKCSLVMIRQHKKPDSTLSQDKPFKNRLLTIL